MTVKITTSEGVVTLGSDGESVIVSDDLATVLVSQEQGPPGPKGPKGDTGTTTAAHWVKNEW